MLKKLWALAFLEQEPQNNKTWETDKSAVFLSTSGSSCLNPFRHEPILTAENLVLHHFFCLYHVKQTKAKQAENSAFFSMFHCETLKTMFTIVASQCAVYIETTSPPLQNFTSYKALLSKKYERRELATRPQAGTCGKHPDSYLPVLFFKPTSYRTNFAAQIEQAKSKNVGNII